MTPRAPYCYAKDVARALATPGGHLHIGRCGFTLHYENARLSGYDCENVKQQASLAGLPVIDSREAPFDLVSRLVVRGPMTAVNADPSPPPWHGFAYAPLAIVAAAYKRIGAEVLNIPDLETQETLRLQRPDGDLDTILNSWLAYVEQHAD